LYGSHALGIDCICEVALTMAFSLKNFFQLKKLKEKAIESCNASMIAVKEILNCKKIK
jgi:hypothetical protein